jgi:integrase
MEAFSVRFHYLRHTNASLLMAEGVDIQTIRNRLGHAKASTTSDMYGHVLDDRDGKASDKLENLLRKQL